MAQNLGRYGGIESGDYFYNFDKVLEFCPKDYDEYLLITWYSLKIP